MSLAFHCGVCSAKLGAAHLGLPANDLDDIGQQVSCASASLRLHCDGEHRPGSCLRSGGTFLPSPRPPTHCVVCVPSSALAVRGMASEPRSRKNQRRSDYELAEHQQGQALLRNKGQKNQIDQILKRHPEDIPDVFELLVNKGRLARQSSSFGNGAGVTGQPQDAAVGDNVKEEGAAPSSADEGASSLGVAEPPTGDEAVVHDVLGATINESYLRFGGRHGSLGRAWKAILSVLEPISFTPQNQSALIPKGRREVCCDLAVECVEFMTGCDESFSFPGSLRQTSELLRFLQENNEENGRPAMMLRLPPNWDIDGWWSIVSHNEEHDIVKQKGCGMQLTVTMEDMNLDSPKEFAMVTLTRNYSLRRALFQDTSSTKQFNLYTHYIKKSSEDSPMKSAPVGNDAAKPATRVKRRMASPVRAVVRDEKNDVPPPPKKAKAAAKTQAKKTGKDKTT